MMYREKKFIYDDKSTKYVIEAIEKGLAINSINLTDEQLTLWIDYVKGVLNILQKEYSSIYLNFLRLINVVQFSNQHPSEKMISYVTYLLEAVKIMK